MSVIFGIKENNRIIIAGDKRGSSIDGKTLSDDLDKVLMINDHLAFSSAGNAAIEKAISIDLNKATNKDCLTTDDLLDIIKAFYKRVADTNCDAILALPFYFLIAGKGNDYDSHRRYRTVLDSFSSERIKDEYIETTEHLLKGDYGFMCQYDDEPDFETVWSSIFDLDSLVIYRAEGDPRKKKFVTDNRLHDLIRRG